MEEVKGSIPFSSTESPRSQAWGFFAPVHRGEYHLKPANVGVRSLLFPSCSAAMFGVVITTKRAPGT